MIPSKTVAFIGPPLPIPLLIAKAIAKKYNLGYLNPEETILKWEESNWSCLTSEDDERLKNIAGQVFGLAVWYVRADIDKIFLGSRPNSKRKRYIL
jgi:hypothetical protein